MLEPLRTSGGNFAITTAGCVVNDQTELHDYPPDPAAPEGFWFLVRAVLSTGNLSYDTLSPGQVAGRDEGIAASGQDRP